MVLHLNDEIKPYLTEGPAWFDQIMSWRGEQFRFQDGRLTQRIRLGGKYYFIKQHHGVGWKEIFKNITQFRLPVVSAMNEVNAIFKAQKLGILTAKVVGYGVRGLNPAKKESFIIMEELSSCTSLEDLYKNKPPSFKEKSILIKAVAEMARTIHQNGINHRDFYLCHFLLRDLSHIFLIDLHRAQIRKNTPKRWIIKDLSGLYFSTFHIPLTQHDLFRFMSVYSQQPLRTVLKKEKYFWQQINSNGEKMYREHN